MFECTVGPIYCAPPVMVTQDDAAAVRAPTALRSRKNVPGWFCFWGIEFYCIYTAVNSSAKLSNFIFSRNSRPLPFSLLVFILMIGADTTLAGNIITRWSGYLASMHWLSTGPGGTYPLAEGGPRTQGYWQHTYVPQKRPVILRNPSKRADEERENK